MNVIDQNKKTVVLFFRNYKAFTGGHLKVWHYFSHLLNEQRYDPYIYFTENSSWDQTNPFLKAKNKVIATPEEINPDVYFLAGKDWDMPVSFDPQKPIINFIQHVRHSNPKNPLYQYLNNKAIRICVSDEVKNALLETKKTNGPVFSIPNGFETPPAIKPLDFENKNKTLLILALKNHQMGDELTQKLSSLNIKVKLIKKKINQEAYLSEINKSFLSVFLPNPTEGFFLPAIESMALNSLVVCPDCIGNRSFCKALETCIMPKEYTLEGLVSAIKFALSMSIEQQLTITNKAKKLSDEFTLKKEKNRFINILDQATKLW